VFSKRDAHVRCRGSVRKADEMDAPLRLLTAHGFIREQEVYRNGPGRKPSQNYEVHPLWLAQNAQNTRNCPFIADSVDSAQCAQEIPV